ncbi:preprotein translocase, YajC subunit [Brevibacterium mcbrellneri ATCC 49030]|uniref:Preprotein translocase, YajC subunit n=1 Tax=Brevibacterium mcbrellneri ATCC 49030 TaxID=585530 RepID=D4YPA4_9MICO|nr:preprotein translocase, YajC subunit [Brevibacterium mcbrellneri ATCC 49030]
MVVEIILLVALGGLLLFFMMNTRKRQKAQQEKLSNNLRVGATVMTSFGMFGTVTDVDEDGIKVTVETTPGTNVVIHRQTIAQIEAPEGEAPAVPEADADVSSDVASDVDEPAVEESKADTAPRITDAELDAMNEAKRNAMTNDNADTNDSDKK